VHSRLRQQLAAMHTPCDQLGSTFDHITQAAYTAWQQAEDAYDRDTNHGLQHERQAQWQAQVRQQLLDLAAFAEKDT
jgi:predicted secreted Zn-dependent protease